MNKLLEAVLHWPKFATLLRMRTAAFLLILWLTAGFLLAQDAPMTSATSPEAEQVVEGVLKELRRGLEEHSQHRAQSVFDAERFSNYLSFQDQLGQFFASYDPIVIRYRVLEAQLTGDDETALVELQMEADPPDGRGGVALRRDQQVRITLHHVGKSWKITDLRPREFFTP